MAAILSGTYTCKARRLLYTYDAVWDSKAAGIIQWEANVSYDRRLASFRGITPAAGHDDESEIVRAKVHDCIEEYSEKQIGTGTAGMTP